MSVHWPIFRSCLGSPGRVRVVDHQRTWSGASLVAGSQHVAAKIRQLTAAKHIGVMLPPAGVFPMAALGVWSLGRTVVPLNFLLKREEFDYVVKDSEIDLVVTSRAVLDAIDCEPRGVGLLCLEDVSFAGMPDVFWPALATDEDLAVILYTSGTSGRPKGVMLTHGALSANVQQCIEWVKLSRRDVLVGILPQFHSFGLTVLTLLPLTCGAKVVYAPRFVPQRIVKMFREHRPTFFVGLPSMYNALLSVKKADASDFESLRYAVSGGEPLPRAVFESFRERFEVTICEGYGLTETAPVTNWLRLEDFRLGSVGRPLPGVTERIVDAGSGRNLPAGEEGEIRIAGPNVMRGYFKLPELTKAVFDEDGFFRTGDIGKLDDEGYLYITGRLKEMMIIGGENVFPREIEEVLNQHASVRETGVIGVADDMRGEVPVAFVELEEGVVFDEPELRSFCRERLAGYKVPRRVIAVEALPRNPTGKILRRELGAMLAEVEEIANDPAE